MRDVRWTALSLLVVVGAASVVVVRAQRATLPMPERRATEWERFEVAAAVANAEAAWKVESEESFPRDLWSQRDDFHGKERDLARALAGERGLPVEDVLGGVDDDLHRAKVQSHDATDTRNARAVPCKPRPFYD